jgi:hypothetical protein
MRRTNTLFLSGLLLLTSLTACGGGNDDLCGNGQINAGEACDDGNTANGDACPANCQAGFEGNEATCSDDTDNDLDGAFDCDDPDCAATIACGNNNNGEGDDVTCNDCIDNDLDGFSDCQDINCQGLAICQGSATEDSCAACSDGLDNDNNTFIDCDDFGCSRNDNLPNITNLCPVENNDATCSDGLDNDGDNFTDCDDFDCGPTAACGALPEDNDAACSDGVSNDGDNFIDCADFDCSQNPNVTVCAAQAKQIQQIQGPATDAGHVNTGAVVSVENVFVTGVRGNAGQTVTLFVQEPNGETTPEHVYPRFAGVVVFFNAGQSANITIPAVGSCVSVSGTVSEFNGLTEITAPTLTVQANTAACGTAPIPATIFPDAAVPPGGISFSNIATDLDPAAANDQAGDLTEAFEAVLVTLPATTVVAAPDQFAEFPLAQAGNTTGPQVDVDDFLFNLAPSNGQNFNSLTGVISFAFGHFVLLPRSAADAQ